MGIRSPVHRVVIEAKDQVGVVSDLGTATKDYDVKIASLAVFHRGGKLKSDRGQADI